MVECRECQIILDYHRSIFQPHNAQRQSSPLFIVEVEMLSFNDRITFCLLSSCFNLQSPQKCFPQSVIVSSELSFIQVSVAQKYLDILVKSIKISYMSYNVLMCLSFSKPFFLNRFSFQSVSSSLHCFMGTIYFWMFWPAENPTRPDLVLIWVLFIEKNTQMRKIECNPKIQLFWTGSLDNFYSQSSLFSSFFKIADFVSSPSSNNFSDLFLWTSRTLVPSVVKSRHIWRMLSNNNKAN